MRQIGKPGETADLGNRFIGFHDLALGVHDSGYIDVLDDGSVGTAFEFPAKVVGTDVKLFRKCFQSNVFIIVVMDIVDDLTDERPFDLLNRLWKLADNCHKQQIKQAMYILILKGRVRSLILQDELHELVDGVPAPCVCRIDAASGIDSAQQFRRLYL